jgi:septum formation inhibitor-activating ATPase MinD
MTQRIAVLSGRGGAGKSLLTCGIGEALAGLGKTVLLVDGSQGLRSLELYMGLTEGILYTCPDLAAGKCRAADVLVEDENHPGLWLLPAAQNLPSDKDLKENYGKALEIIQNGGEDVPSFDFILTDCGGSPESQLTLASLSERPVLVVLPDPAGLRAADKLRKLTAKEPEMIINRFDSRDLAKHLLPSPGEFQEMLPLPVLGIFEENDGLRRAVLTGGDVVREMPEFANTAKRLLGQTVPLPLLPGLLEDASVLAAQTPEISGKRESFWSRVFGRGK